MNYFYDGLSDRQVPAVAGADDGDRIGSKETQDLVRAYYLLGERPRRKLLDLAKSLNGSDLADS